MLNEQELAELAELESGDRSLDTDDMVRLAELLEKKDLPEEQAQTNLEELSVQDLKDIAKKEGIRGYANMKKETLIKAITALDSVVEPEKPAEPEATETDRLIAEGYTYHGTNGHAHFYQAPDGKAVMSDGRGLRSVGNKFGEKLLRSLKGSKNK